MSLIRQKALERELLRIANLAYISSGRRKTVLPPEPTPPRLMVGEKYGAHESLWGACFSDGLPSGFHVLDQ